ncbi:hypothetical protein [uncultured Streptococcus sp.]|mgnify:CR=1 FL=1|uniref:hypothetical protein n=1 Tax=uncultured Streptococcus sp. TaxID=83427 RepID=UPI0027DCEAA8|nr:hypothetical protein [uncultured Streptococcus sp.]
MEKYDNSTNTTSYVYDSQKTASAKVGDSVKATSASGLTSVPTGYEREKAYGKNSTSKVTIEADGSSVLKVYYSLIRYTFVFNLNSGGNVLNSNGYPISTVSGFMTVNGNNYTDSKYTISNLVLGQDVSPNWPLNVNDISSWYKFRGWYDSAATIYYVTKRYEVTNDMIAGADSSHQRVFIARWQSSLQQYRVHYYLQNADNPKIYDNSAYSQDYNASTANLSAKDIDGFKYNSSKSSYNRKTRTYNFYYDRNSYNITYLYGSKKLDKKENILFDANINTSTYNFIPPKPANTNERDYTDYNWGGWYATHS